MRAREPDAHGTIVREGAAIPFEVHGTGERTILFMPTWSIIHSRLWKMQVPYLARHHRVVSFDGRGNGKADRFTDPAMYAEAEFAADALAVLDATSTPSAIVVSLSMGAVRSLMLAAEHADRVAGLIFIGPSLPTAPGHAERKLHSFEDRLTTHEGWAKYNRHYWQQDYADFLEFFFSCMFTEPHSTKPIEDCVQWGLETTPEVLAASCTAPGYPGPADTLALCARVKCPVLVIHGDEDAISPHARGRALAELTGGSLVTLEGSGHAPNVRDPVQVNLLLDEFARRVFPPASRSSQWVRGRRRPRRALFVSSPIGLGHARRDLAIARALRALAPDLRIEWLAQDPVTRVLEAEGEYVHPASAWLASESRHIASESHGHELNVFEAWRRMDEILLNNFMVFHDVVRDEAYDLWIGDEAWEVDYYLHENPELKRAPFVWLTDFVGWLPMPDGGEREAALTADYNAEMIEHIARHPHVRDRALFVGSPEDIVPQSFGPGLPKIRDWTEENFRFTGYVTGFDDAEISNRAALRAELGYRPDERVCVAAVGGSGVGGPLLSRLIEALPDARRRIPELRMIAVAGPRIDPTTLPRAEGLEVRAYVHGLHRHLAACDLALVQGGLTTTMELTAARRPFLYFPLRNHFEQNHHVAYRLDRYGAGRRMDYDGVTAAQVADAIATDITREVAYRAVERDGACRAAEAIAELL